MKKTMCDCPWPCPIKHKKSCDAIKCPWRKSIFRHVYARSEDKNMNNFNDNGRYKTSLSIVLQTNRGNNLGYL